MKKGKTLEELAAELQTRADSQEDFIASTEEMKMQSSGETLELGENEFAMNDNAVWKVGSGSQKSSNGQGARR